MALYWIENIPELFENSLLSETEKYPNLYGDILPPF